MSLTDVEIRNVSGNGKVQRFYEATKSTTKAERLDILEQAIVATREGKSAQAIDPLKQLPFRENEFEIIEEIFGPETLDADGVPEGYFSPENPNLPRKFEDLSMRRRHVHLSHRAAACKAGDYEAHRNLVKLFKLGEQVARGIVLTFGEEDKKRMMDEGYKFPV